MLHKGNYLVCGITRSGKGQLMRGLIERYRKAGLMVLYWTSKEVEYLGVKDMVDYIELDNPQRFYETCDKVKDETPCIIIIDEAGDFKRTHEEELRIMLNRWAAYGVEVYLQVQRAKLVTPNLRNACDNCISFKQRTEDSKFLAEQYGDVFLQVAAEDFPKGTFIAQEGGFSDPVYGRSWEADESGQNFKRV